MKKRKWLWSWIILCVIMTGCEASDSENRTVATYNGGSLTLADLAAHRNKMKRDSRFRKNSDQITSQFVFEHAVNMEMIIAKGLKEKLHLDPRIRTEIHYFMADLFLKIMQEKLVPKIDKDTFTEAEIKDYFDAHPESYSTQKPYDFEEKKAYIRNDLLYAKYRDAWQETYDKLRQEFSLETNETNLKQFYDEENNQ